MSANLCAGAGRLAKAAPQQAPKDRGLDASCKIKNRLQKQANDEAGQHSE
jgi:hypothetical protein